MNASGALQNGASENPDAIDLTTVVPLLEVTEGVCLRIVQISAAGVRLGGDEARSSRNLVILLPTLVTSPEIYVGQHFDVASRFRVT